MSLYVQTKRIQQVELHNNQLFWIDGHKFAVSVASFLEIETKKNKTRWDRCHIRFNCFFAIGKLLFMLKSYYKYKILLSSFEYST